MKKYALNLMKIAVGLTILLGVLLILLANEKSMKKIVSDDIENISKLSSSIIYAEIDNSLTKPIYVSQTIANDLFLKNWLKEESTMGGSAEQTVMMQQYLLDYCKKYGYDSVAVTSEKSGIHYYQEGINNVISTNDAHDVWYYDFIASEEGYRLNVDFDEVNSDELTVFADCKIIDSDGALMGVVGVGIKMSHLQDLLKKYENEYDLRAFLMNKEGLIQIDTVDENIEATQFFDDPEAHAFKDKIINNKSSMETMWYPELQAENCLITQYVDNLDWYIVIQKNTAHIQEQMQIQIHKDLFGISVIIVLVLLMVSYVINRYNRMLLKTASMDDVTNLPNSKMFSEIFKRNLKRPACRQGIVFMFDIDHFKTINDRFGHLFGNKVLYRISNIAKNEIGDNGVISRWGGDEFVGVIYGELEYTKEVLTRLVNKIANMKEGEFDSITISLGAANILGRDNLDVLIREADALMYQSKKNGKNQITFLE